MKALTATIVSAPEPSLAIGSITLSSIDPELDSLEEGLIASPTGSISLWSCDIHEFMNECHSPDSGRFCGGGSGGNTGTPSPGKFTPDEEAAIKAYGHDPKDYGENRTPIPGTNSWLDSHGITREVYDARPTKRWENSKDPVFDEIYTDARQRRFAKGKIANQSSGFIMVRKPAPGAEEAGFGEITAQARPDNPIVTDARAPARAARNIANAEARQEKVSKFTTEDVITERQARVNRAKADVGQLKSQMPQEIVQEARESKDVTEANLSKAKKSKDPAKIATAELKDRDADYHLRDQKRKAALLQKDPVRAIAIAEQEQSRAESALSRAKADPQKALKNTQDYAADQVTVRQAQMSKTAVKYVFPPGKGTAARIEVNQDPRNVKNLVEGKGRVYFVMEGNIKADAVLSRVKKEDPKAAVISVPSVTSWPTGETDWVANKYLKGRDVVLIPDSDGFFNADVRRQAVNLKGKLAANGVGSVKIAAPPLVRDKKGKLDIEPLFYPTGAKDSRKGVDDHLGLGKGTLGDLVYYDTPPPKFDLSEYSRPTAPKGTRVKTHAIPNANRTLEAISDMAGERGAGKISDKSIEKYTGLSSTSVNESVKRLEKFGVVKVHHIFDPTSLGQGRRVQIMEYDEVKRVTRKAGAKVPNLDLKYISDFDNHEVAPIIEITDNRFLTRQGPVKSLASSYKNLKTNVTTPGVRIVQTPEGARRYGVPIGQPIPEELSGATGAINLVSNNQEGLEAFIIEDSLEPTESVFLATGSIQLVSTTEEFHLPGQHEQESHGGGRGGGGTHRLRNLAIGLGAIAVGAGAIYLVTRRTRAPVPKTVSKWADAADPEIAEQYDNMYGGKNAIIGSPTKWSSFAGTGRVSTSREAQAKSTRVFSKLPEHHPVRITKIGEAKGVYRIEAADGKKLYVYDMDGTLADDYLEEAANSLAAMHEMYPMRRPAQLVLVNNEQIIKLDPRGKNADAFVMLNDTPQIYLNVDKITGSRLMSAEMADQAMPSHIKVSQMHYNITHEYGHKYDMFTGMKSGNRLWWDNDSDAFESLGSYGKSIPIEGYAEAFAEWHVSKGMTSNAAARIYAQQEGWFGT